MDTTQAKNGITKAKDAIGSAEEKFEGAETAIKERVEQARDMIEDFRDRAEMALHERPYLLPVAAGALGFGVGVLVGSKLTRIIAVTAAGALLSDTVRGQVVKLSREWIRDMSEKLETGEEAEDVEDGAGEPSIA
jgi:ElaB/YqjD/DUF883 family membrane-anchored ribosome-binding protein